MKARKTDTHKSILARYRAYVHYMLNMRSGSYRTGNMWHRIIGKSALSVLHGPDILGHRTKDFIFNSVPGTLIARVRIDCISGKFLQMDAHEDDRWFPFWSADIACSIDGFHAAVDCLNALITAVKSAKLRYLV